MKRWWDSTTTTIALTVVVAVVLGFSLQQTVSSGLLYLGLPRQQTVQNGDPRLVQQLPGRVAALLDVLDATADTERPTVVAAAQRPQVHVRLLDAPIPNLVNRGEPDANLLRCRRHFRYRCTTAEGSAGCARRKRWQEARPEATVTCGRSGSSAIWEIPAKGANLESRVHRKGRS